MLPSTATHTNLATFDKVQNQALRFIGGAMETTPTRACEIECNIDLLDIRRDATNITTYERYQRLVNHPNKALIQTWKKKTRNNQQLYLTTATTLLPPQPPYRTAYQPTLCPHLIVKSAWKPCPAHILKSLAADTHIQRARTAVKRADNIVTTMRQN